MKELIKEHLKQFSLPSKPKSFSEEYIFPEKVEDVLSVDLGNWMFKLAAWKGYAIRLLADIEIEKTFIEAKHDNKVAQKIASGSGEKRISKDHALGQLIIDDSEFRGIRTQLISAECEYSALKQVIEIYTMQIEVISREISRRALEIKLMQKGVISND